MARVQITGGAFQDAEGNVLANGSLVMQLNQDEQSSSGQVCAGIKITVPLDSSGNVAGTVLVWPNDLLTPGNSYYRVSGYDSKGQLAFGPNSQQVLSSPSPYNLDAWVPNQVVNWNPPLQPLLLQTNETNNGSQSLLDLHAGSNITLTDNGSGRVTVAGTTSPITLQTNEVNNGSQTLLDLHAGSNITLTDNGLGQVTVASTATAVDALPRPSSGKWIEWIGNSLASTFLTLGCGSVVNSNQGTNTLAADPPTSTTRDGFTVATGNNGSVAVYNAGLSAVNNQTNLPFFPFGTGRTFFMQAPLKADCTAAGTTAVILVFGLSDSMNSAGSWLAYQNAVWIGFSGTQASPGNWSLYASKAGVLTTVASSTAVSFGTEVIAKVAIDASGTITGFINGVSFGTISSGNAPTTVALGPGLVQSCGSTASGNLKGHWSYLYWEQSQT